MRKKYIELEEEESPFEILEARKVIETEIVGLAAKKGCKKGDSYYPRVPG